jgi:UDP-N-acetylglucosamine 2-epimerase (non-hydrolysing)
LAPTLSARDNLLREGISPGRIYVTGNTVIDALFEVARQAVAIGVELHPEARLILLTAHRRENFGAPLQEVCQAVLDIVERNPTVEVLYPVHPNPNVRRVVQAFLSSHPRVLLAEPLDYGAFVSALQRAFLILTDSGGVQEEAPALGKPVLVLRHETERPEAVTAGVVRLVGTSRAKIAAEVQRLLDDPVHYRSMARGASPYGDGRAAARIVAVVGRFLGIEGVERIPMFDG